MTDASYPTTTPAVTPGIPLPTATQLAAALLVILNDPRRPVGAARAAATLVVELVRRDGLDLNGLLAAGGEVAK